MTGRATRSRWWAVLAVTVATGTGAATATGCSTEDGYARIVFGTDTVLAEMAVTAEEKTQGLMHREDVPDGTGMLFVYTDSRVRSFWMVNTYVPLDIAYLDSAFRVVDIQQLEPNDDTSRPSRAPAMYALEVRQGWFAEHGIQVGDVAEIEFGVRGP